MICLLPAVSAIAPTLPLLIEVRAGLFQINRLSELHDKAGKPETNNTQIQGLARQLRSSLQEIQEMLGDSTYPFEHSSTDVTLRQYALSTVPALKRFEALFSAAVMAEEKLTELYSKILARIALIAEASEKAIGLEPLPTLKQSA